MIAMCTSCEQPRLSVVLLGKWAAMPGQKSPVQLPAVNLWRAPFDLRALRDLATRVHASWLVVGEGIDDELLVRAAPLFTQLAPAARYAVLGPADDVDRCQAWLRRGAMVYYAATAPAQLMIGALSAAMTLNALVIDVCFQQADLFRRMQASGFVAGTAGLPTVRELEVLRLIRRGLSNAEIADALTITENTVQHHISHLYRKLRASSRTKAIEQARLFGL